MLGGEVRQLLVASGQVAQDQDAVGVRSLEHRSVGQGHVGPVVDVTQEEAVVTGSGDFVDTLQDLDVERIRDVPGDHPDQRAPAPAQAPGEEVWLVAELGCDSQHPLPRLVADRDARFPAVQDARHGRDRHRTEHLSRTSRDFGRRQPLGRRRGVTPADTPRRARLLQSGAHGPELAQHRHVVSNDPVLS